MSVREMHSEEVLFELEDVEVERVDAVDRPATGRRWLIVKSEEEDQSMLNVSEFEAVLRAGLTQLKREYDAGELKLSEGAAAALNALAALVGEGGELFQASVEKSAEPEEAEQIEAAAPEEEIAASADAGEAAAAEPETVAKEEAEPVEAVAESDNGYGYPDPQFWALILAELRAIRELLSKQTVQKTAPPPSKQPDLVSEPRPRIRKWGEGLFEDIIFGQ